jgi:hypothetical protein
MSGADYEIRITGRVGAAAVRMLCDLEVRPEGPEATCIRGRMADQAALHGVLQRLHDLGVEVVSINQLPFDG